MGQVFSNVIENCNCGSQTEDNELQDIKLDIKMIKENHLHHIEKDISEMKMDIKIILSKLK